MIRSARRLTPWAAGLLAALTGGVAFGQGNTFNPYGNSGYADYREFGSPKYANDASLPGQARLQAGGVAGRGANQFESYLNSLEGGGAGDLGGARGAGGLPYYRAQQLYNAQSGRNGGRLNDTPANRLYQARVAERGAAYQAALAEPDAKKRAQMLQRLDQDAIDRPLSAIANQASSRRSSPLGTPRSTAGSVARSPESSSPVGRGAAARPAARPTPAPAPARIATPPAARAATLPATPASAATPSAAAAAPVVDAPATATPTDPSSVPVPAPR